MRLSLFLLSCLSLSAESVTFSKDIAPILFQYCAPCHRPGEAAPFSLLSYEDARKHAEQIAIVTGKRFMPPWPPEPGYGDFAGVKRLSDRQIDLLAQWAKTGQAEGDRAALPPAPHFVEGWQLGQPDLVLHMRQPYQMPASGVDVFRNFVIPVELKQTRYIRAMELRPGSKRAVHHANLIVDHARMLRERDGQDGQPGFPGMDVETEVSGEFDPDSHFLFWKPGSPPQEEPQDMGWKLDPGSDLIVNLHLQPTGKPETVDVAVGLYFADRPAQRFPMLLQLEHDGALDIPPGAAQFVVTDHLNLPIAVDVLAIYPHAHYLGKQIDAWAVLPGEHAARFSESTIGISTGRLPTPIAIRFRCPPEPPSRCGLPTTTPKIIRATLAIPPSACTAAIEASTKWVMSGFRYCRSRRAKTTRASRCSKRLC